MDTRLLKNRPKALLKQKEEYQEQFNSLDPKAEKERKVLAKKIKFIEESLKEICFQLRAYIVSELEAGEKALKSSKTEIAKEHFLETLPLLDSLPDPLEMIEEELEVLSHLGKIFVLEKGYKDSDVEKVYLRIYYLLGHSNEVELSVYQDLWFYALVCKQEKIAKEIALKRVQQTQKDSDSPDLLDASLALALTFCVFEEWKEAQSYLANINPRIQTEQALFQQKFREEDFLKWAESIESFSQWLESF